MRFKWLGLIFTFFSTSCQSQPKLERAAGNNTLLWEISGKGLKKPSYIFGTMHMLCPEDAKVSRSLMLVLDRVKELYFEVDIDDMVQIFGSLKAMNMNDGNRLQDLIAPEAYERVKSYFEKHSPLPFSMIENYKPMLLSGLIEEQQLPCKSTNGMEMVILEESNKRKLEVKGLETMQFQAGLFDSIPYQEQALELVRSVDSVFSQQGAIDTLLQTYRAQDLEMIDQLTTTDKGSSGKYLDLLLYKRNRNWAAQFDTIAPNGPVLFAIGAGHLPGNEGVLSLLGKKGYTVTPLKN